MTVPPVHVPSGLPGLDAVLTGLRLGDNVVWRVDDLADAAAFVDPFCFEAEQHERPVLYFRFADHAPLVPGGTSARLCALHPDRGFDGFVSEVFSFVAQAGRGMACVFDCLTDLAVDWYSDRMVANFFRVICPYLHGLDATSYLAVRRHGSAELAMKAIQGEVEVLVDVFRQGGRRFIHPVKVTGRHTDTMYLLHAWEGDRFVPVTKSATIAAIRSATPQPWLDFSGPPVDAWTRTFQQGHALIAAGPTHPLPNADARALHEKLIRIMVTRDPHMVDLARRHLTLEDLVEIGRRLIGTGLIGGKACGMLLARAILVHGDEQWRDKLEVHDSFYVGSDVFHTFLVRNDCWWARRRVQQPDAPREACAELAARMLEGTFPRALELQLVAMLDYFGQSPVIVRSSSLLEDAYGTAFSGKYTSVFCTNRGTPRDRLGDLLDAMRMVYASTVSLAALDYRARFGLLDSDEQMALLIQRVSGEVHGSLFYPDLAGVGFSYNPFQWHPDIDPRAGFIRLVFGLGTRAVGAPDQDNMRIVALNAPHLRPEGLNQQDGPVSQRRVDLLHLADNQQLTLTAEVALATTSRALQGLLTGIATADAVPTPDPEVARLPLTFDRLLAETDLVSDLRDLLHRLEIAYHHAVDVEFTVNFLDAREYRVNVLQCRPYQVHQDRTAAEERAPVPGGERVLASAGPVIGHSRTLAIDEIVYVVPDAYGGLSWRDRREVARVVRDVVHADRGGVAPSLLLIGPGRWGTSIPELGVPVTIADIDRVAVLCECSGPQAGLVPDASLGSHFFNDLTELDILYLAVYPGRDGHVLERDFLLGAPNALIDLVASAEPWSEVVRVVRAPHGRRILLRADAARQQVSCWVIEDR